MCIPRMPIETMGCVEKMMATHSKTFHLSCKDLVDGVLYQDVEDDYMLSVRNHGRWVVSPNFTAYLTS
jgi:hypothetical protein